MECKIRLDKAKDKVVVMEHILFYGKKNIEWDKVEEYLKQYKCIFGNFDCEGRL